MIAPDLGKLDFRVKVWLLIVSVLAIALLAAAAVREEFGSEWRSHQRAFRGLLAEKATDARGHQLLAQFEIGLRQAVVPPLGVTDRCVSCHVGIDDPRMAEVPNPHRVHPGAHLDRHPPEQFGCTICHRGQGPAVVFAEAKGAGYFWDYPLLPLEFTQSSCGSCHAAAEVAHAGGERYARGAALYNEQGCPSCHKLAGRGGGLGPALDREGAKVPHELPMAAVSGPHTLPQWLSEHFADPQQIVAGSQMKTPGLSYEENLALTTFMLSLTNRDLPRSYLSPAKLREYATAAEPSALGGEELYNRYCAVCHDVGTYGRYDKFYQKLMPAVRGASLLVVADSTFLHLTVRDGRPGTLMPAWGPGAGGLTDGEIGRLVAHLRAAMPPAAVTASVPAGLSPEAGNAERGAQLFARFCTGCHGPMGIGGVAPALANPVFHKAADARFIYRTIAYGRVNTAMPAFRAPNAGGLADTELVDLVAFVRSLGRPESSPMAAVQSPEEQSR